MKSLSRAELKGALVRRQKADHKGVFGHVLIVAGSRGMAGAAILAARAALRSGAGLVSAAVPSGIQNVVAAGAPEALTLALPESAAGAVGSSALGDLARAQAARRYDVLAIGPGLSTEPAIAVLEILDHLDLPAVIDADALNVLAASAEAQKIMASRRAPAIVTPHPGEMARCLKISAEEVARDRAAAAARLAKEWRVTVLLKGSGTIISDGTRLTENPTGGPGLAKGGSGDLLTGLVAGLWAQMIASKRVPADPFLAAALGAWLHGTAGELAEKERTAWAVAAGDVLEHFGAAFALLA